MDSPRDEGLLVGGNMAGEVQRIGATVRRQAGPWTPAVHALLLHLQRAEFSGAPRALGIDERGRGTHACRTRAERRPHLVSCFRPAPLAQWQRSGLFGHFVSSHTPVTRSDQVTLECETGRLLTTTGENLRERNGTQRRRSSSGRRLR